jgi:hypothetical protein
MRALRIQDVVRPVIKRVPDDTVRNAILSSFEQSGEALAHVEECFETLTSREWPQLALNRFFNAWRNPSVGSASVAGLTVRILAEAEEAQGEAREALFLSAAYVARITGEDLGLFSDTHGALYARMAEALCDSDEWQRAQYGIPTASDYQTWVRTQRRLGPDIVEALMLSIVAEIYNYGEFTVIAPKFQKWLQSMGRDKQRRNHELEFVTAHVGNTESGHFLYAVRALEQYCRGTGAQLDMERFAQCCTSYLEGVGASYATITSALLATAESAPVREMAVA